MTFSLPQTFEWEFRESITGKFLPGIYLDCKCKDASGLWSFERWVVLKLQGGLSLQLTGAIGCLQ